MYSLYTKTHNQTGLRYLGYTKRADVHKYPGSGVYWTAHLDKHGYDYTTEIIFQTENKDEMRAAGIYYSKLWNVVCAVDSSGNKLWANLKEEDGYGGAMPGELNGMYGKIVWNNGVEVKAALTCPGPEWVKGLLESRTAGLQWWNAGTKQTMCATSPGVKWVKGRLPGATWWTDGINEKKLVNAPLGWNPGRVSKMAGYAFWNNGVAETRAKECPGEGWIPGSLRKKNTGLTTYNNGIVNKMFSTNPGTGWTKGRITRRR